VVEKQTQTRKCGTMRELKTNEEILEAVHLWAKIYWPNYMAELLSAPPSIFKDVIKDDRYEAPEPSKTSGVYVTLIELQPSAGDPLSMYIWLNSSGKGSMFTYPGEWLFDPCLEIDLSSDWSLESGLRNEIATFKEEIIKNAFWNWFVGKNYFCDDGYTIYHENSSIWFYELDDTKPQCSANEGIGIVSLENSFDWSLGVPIPTLEWDVATLGFRGDGVFFEKQSKKGIKNTAELVEWLNAHATIDENSPRYSSSSSPRFKTTRPRTSWLLPMPKLGGYDPE
jgi:hypothetical protein